VLGKFAVILQAGPGTHESHARMFHSMVYAKELYEAGQEVRLIFDGAATAWLAKWGQPQNDDDRAMGGFFTQLKNAGVAYAVCDFCAAIFKVREQLRSSGEPLSSEYLGHPSIARLASDGFQLLVL
jgi:hypothetical protein